MKSVINLLLSLFVLVTLICWSMVSCSKTEPVVPTNLPDWINQTTVSTAFAVATSTGLKMGINESVKRQAMAKLLQYVASQCNTFATAGGNNNPEDLAAFITNNIPGDIKEAYPDLVSFVVPLVVSGYGQIYAAHSKDAQTLSQWLSWAATGISLGAASYAGN